jgi:hypothetical protein
MWCWMSCSIKLGAFTDKRLRRSLAELRMWWLDVLGSHSKHRNEFLSLTIHSSVIYRRKKTDFSWRLFSKHTCDRWLRDYLKALILRSKSRWLLKRLETHVSLYAPSCFCLPVSKFPWKTRPSRVRAQLGRSRVGLSRLVYWNSRDKSNLVDGSRLD